MINVGVNAQNTVGITYIANEGFLICGKSDSVLIDGIFNESWGIYHIPSGETLTKERNALSPFDGVRVLLVSHKDKDHINADYVSEHLANNTKSIFIGPTQVTDKLKSTVNYSTISGRIKSITPSAGTKTDTLIQNMKFKVMSIPHEATPSTQNTPFLFSIDGIKIFHAGDAISTTLNVYQNLNLDSDSIDIAFLPCWFFDSNTGNLGKDIIKYIKPKAVILMHIEVSKFAE
jgi:L-ascorbate metabolism protein UlaG (beta-lactamase superfamily)